MYVCMECDENGNHHKCIEPKFCECAKDNHYGELENNCDFPMGKEFCKEHRKESKK